MIRQPPASRFAWGDLFLCKAEVTRSEEVPFTARRCFRDSLLLQLADHRSLVCGGHFALERASRSTHLRRLRPKPTLAQTEPLRREQFRGDHNTLKTPRDRQTSSKERNVISASHVL